MGIGLPRRSTAVALALAGITGAGLGLSLTINGGGLSIALLVVSIGISPLLAGWLSPRLWHIVLFPISVSVGTSIAVATNKSLAYDFEPIGYVILITVIYGGSAAVPFFAGWIGQQFVHWLQGQRIATSRLAIASLAIICYSAAMSISYFTGLPVEFMSSRYTFGGLAPILLVFIATVAGSGEIIWSDYHKGQWSLAGIGLSLLIPGTSLVPPFYQGNRNSVWPGCLRPRGDRGLECTQVEGQGRNTGDT